MATVEQSETSSKYKVIGTRPIRHDGTDKVTGRAKYGADVKMAGLLSGAVLRSPHAHARILSIDTAQAEKYPGVAAVVTSADMPEIGSRIADLGEGMFNMQHLSRNVLAREKVVYKGHAVAAIAAESTHIAKEAIRLIQVEYEVLPHVLDVRAAMQEDAPILHESLRTELFPPSAEDAGDKPTNIAKHFCHVKGDVEAGFAAATTIVEREFTTATVHQGYIEPHTATALWNADGKITVWTSTQGTFCVREQMSGLLQEPLGNIKIVPMEIGGGFGGKIVTYLPPVAALLSRKSGRPVKLVMDRTDVLEATGPTPGSYMRVKMGTDAEGRLLAVDANIVFEAGGFPGSPVPAACMTVFACFDVPNGQVVGYDVCVNKPATKAYRAPGATHAAFAVETIVDELCEKLDMDPLEFRLKNAAKEGTRRIDGVVFPRVGLEETIEAIQSSSHWNSPIEGPNRGRGVAAGFWFNAGLKSTVSAAVNEDGSVSLLEGSTDIGGSRAGIAMQLAETLGITAEDVKPTVVDTDSIGYTDVTGGSRVTYATGWAAVEAARDIQRQAIKRVAKIWDVSADDVRYEEGRLIGPGDNSFTFQEFAAQINKTGEPIIGRGSSDHNEPGGAFGVHCVDVEVDPETGKTEILRYTIAQDAGTAIHPSYVEGQMQGGVVQGIGWALNEEYVFGDDGAMKNATFLDYRMPTSYDVPMIDTIIVEVPNPGHPYGVRGVGEVPIVPPPAAIANAIYRATTVRMRHLPMSPPNLLHELLNESTEPSASN